MTETIRDILLRVQWDWNLNSDNFYIYYEDRILRTSIEKRFIDMVRIDEAHMVFEDIEGNEVFIPIHRVVFIKEMIDDKEKIWLDRR